MYFCYCEPLPFPKNPPPFAHQANATNYESPARRTLAWRVMVVRLKARDRSTDNYTC